MYVAAWTFSAWQDWHVDWGGAGHLCHCWNQDPWSGRKWRQQRESCDCACEEGETTVGQSTRDRYDPWWFIWSFRHWTGEIRVFSDPVTDPIDLNDKFFHLLSCCHTVTVVHGRLVGDPLDLKMFEFTGCVLEEPDHSPDDQNLAGTTIRPFEGSGNELKIIRSFPFDATLKRQSVLIKGRDWGQFRILHEGAPEVIKEHCRPETLPEDFDDLLGFYARHGQRVVACAYRRVPDQVDELMRMPRAQIEMELHFWVSLSLRTSWRRSARWLLASLKRPKSVPSWLLGTMFLRRWM